MQIILANNLFYNIFITFSCHNSLFSFMICCMGRLLDFGSLSRTWLITSWNTSNSGLTMKLMKPATWHVAWLLNHRDEDRKNFLPIWDWGTFVVVLSHNGETSSPNSFSLSPWLKNSSMHLAVHSLCRSQVLVGWATSAEWSTKDIMCVLLLRLVCTACNWVKWSDMSIKIKWC